MPLHHRPPRDETESNAKIEHGEPTAREVKRTPTRAADRLAFARFAISQARVACDRFADRYKLAVISSLAAQDSAHDFVNWEVSLIRESAKAS